MVAAPEDPLARTARWDALRRRIEAAARTGDGSPGDDAGAGGNGTHVPGGETTPPLLELARAARQVLDRYPEVAITITVEAVAGSSSIRVAQTDGGLAVTVSGADRHREQAAAELADLLRRDPTLLSGFG